MEGGKKLSGSSFPSDILWSKDHSIFDSSSEIFGQFSTTTKVIGKESLSTMEAVKKLDYGSKGWSSKNRVSDKSKVRDEGHNQRMESKDTGSYNLEEKVLPFHYSSSIYYGGQDDYTRPASVQNTVFTTFTKDGGEDDSDGATRGNWWKGSLYY